MAVALPQRPAQKEHVPLFSNVLPKMRPFHDEHIAVTITKYIMCAPSLSLLFICVDIFALRGAPGVGTIIFPFAYEVAMVQHDS